MSYISRVPLPSIALVLTTDHKHIPRRPSVVKVAPLAPSPTKLCTVQFDPMMTIHSRDNQPRSLEEGYHSQKKYPQSRHIVFIEEVESMDFTLAESIHEVRINEERLGIGRPIKHKISSVLSSFRNVLCVEFPDTCLCRASRP